MLTQSSPTPGLLGLTPSRRLTPPSSVRASDDAEFARGRRVLFLLIGLWICNAFDLSLTLRARADGMLDEGNPIARAIMEHGAVAVFAFKIALVAGASYVLFNLRRYRCAEMATLIALSAYVAVSVQWRLCYEMYDLCTTSRITPAELARADTLLRYLAVF